MTRIWKVILIISLLLVVVGVALIGVAALTGGSIESIQNHGNVAAYIEVLRNYLTGIFDGVGSIV